MEREPQAERSYLNAGDAHERAMSLPIAEVVRHLLTMLDATTIAVIGGVQETRAVNGWLSGREPQRPQVLRFALQLAAMIANSGDHEVCKAWFHGSNPHLADRVPMILLRDQPLSEVQRDLLGAARLFATRAGASPKS